MTTPQPLSNLQQELLKIYSSNVEEQDLLNIKKYLARYFADKAIADSNQLWEGKNYHFETMKQWLHEDSVRYEL